ncbi:type IV pilus assembly protein PilM [Leptospira fainei serovar Hurstbridge str. BUT 6]|uniref:Type IV pilus assembly protein PilM n=1 Tax=Leptospira fainei serovar Hurstbridge str. BUT 6 TaxID=1193011 RepID=S3W6F7_9LEPT|nr:pilus assembly protein PilM [Leptospira fainei]EPG75722.1 type IV pilus assembly protein PilM [Leptospira fainei serovar Hurstbridge str. BUT 6]
MFLYEKFLTIDYGTCSIKGALFQRVMGNLTLLKAESMPISRMEEKEYETNIQRFLNTYFPGESSLVLALSLDKLFIREISIPLTTEKAVREVIPYEVESRVPFPMETVEVLGSIWRIDQEKSDVITYTAHHAEFDTLADPFREGSTVFRGIFVDSICLGSLIAKHIGKEIPFSNVAQIDIGGKTSLLNITKDGKIVHTRFLSLGGDTLTEEIAKALKIDLEKANALKTSLQFEPFHPPEDGLNLFAKEYRLKIADVKKAFSVVQEFFDRVAEEARRSFLSVGETERPEAIYISGEGSKIRDLDSFLGEKLSLQTRRYDFLSVNPDLYATCYGMAYQLTLPKKSKVDFLETPYVKRLNKNLFDLSAFHPHLILAGISIALFLSVFFLGIISDKRKLAAANKILAEKVKASIGTTVPADADPLEYARKLKDEAKGRTELYRKYLSKPSILDVFYEISTKFPDPGLQAFQFHSLTYDNGHVSIQGRVNEYSEIGIIQRSLENSQMFKKITIEDNRINPGLKTYKVSFTIKMEVASKVGESEL